MGISGIIINLDDYSVATQRRMATEVKEGVLLLEELAKSKDVETKRNVAANVNCSSGAIQILLDEEDWLIRYNLAKNPASSIEVLWKICNDSEKRIQQIYETAQENERVDFLAIENNVLDAITINPNDLPDKLIGKLRSLIKKCS